MKYGSRGLFNTGYSVSYGMREGLVLSSVANLVHLCGEDVGSNPAQRQGRVPSDSLRKFLQEVNLEVPEYQLFSEYCFYRAYTYERFPRSTGPL